MVFHGHKRTQAHSILQLILVETFATGFGRHAELHPRLSAFTKCRFLLARWTLCCDVSRVQKKKKKKNRWLYLKLTKSPHLHSGILILSVFLTEYWSVLAKNVKVNAAPCAISATASPYLQGGEQHQCCGEMKMFWI